MINKGLLTALLIFSFATANAGEPAKNGGYIGAGFGFTELDDDRFAFDWGLDLDDNSEGFGVVGGWKFSRHFALELRYTDFGDFTLSDFTGSADLSTTIASIHAVGMIPLGDGSWELYGAIGFGSVELSVLGESENEQVGAFGLGVRYNITENVSLALHRDAYAWEYVDVVDDAYDMAVVTNGITFRYIF